MNGKLFLSSYDVKIESLYVSFSKNDKNTECMEFSSVIPFMESPCAEKKQQNDLRDKMGNMSKGNNLTKEQNTAEWHLWVFNKARKSCTLRPALADIVGKLLNLQSYFGQIRS